MPRAVTAITVRLPGTAQAAAEKTAYCLWLDAMMISPEYIMHGSQNRKAKRRSVSALSRWAIKKQSNASTLAAYIMKLGTFHALTYNTSAAIVNIVPMEKIRRSVPLPVLIAKVLPVSSAGPEPCTLPDANTHDKKQAGDNPSQLGTRTSGETCVPGARDPKKFL